MAPTMQRKWISWAPLMFSILLAVSAAIYISNEAKTASLAKTQRQLLGTLLECADQAVVVLDGSGRVFSWSTGAERLFGWKAGEVTGKQPDFLMPSDMYAKHSNTLLTKTTTGRVHLVVCTAYCKDGSSIKLNIYARTIVNHVGVYHVAIINKADQVVVTTGNGKLGAAAAPATPAAPTAPAAPR